MRKRGQAWGFDLMVAVTIFLAAILVFFFYSINFPKESQETLDSLFYEGNIIADDLLSEGSPNNWNVTTLIKIGLLNENKINETKLALFYNYSSNNINPGTYSQTKSLLNTKYEYYVNFSKPITVEGNSVEGVGKQPSSNPKNLIRISRFTIYENEPTTLNIYVWE